MLPAASLLPLLISPPQSILPEPFFRLLFVKAHFVPPLTKFNIAPCQTLGAEGLMKSLVSLSLLTIPTR